MGDHVCIVAGCIVPFVLRDSCQGMFQVVGGWWLLYPRHDERRSFKVPALATKGFEAALKLKLFHSRSAGHYKL
jgi:hypothetical protein